MDKTSLGDRMKGYENVSKIKLLRRTPVIIRIDGKAFHTWTKRLSKFDSSLEDDPFSELMFNCMTNTTTELVNSIQNAVVGYTQSDEISILLTDWTALNTDQWFGGSLQKMASVSASVATAYFNRSFKHYSQASEDGPPALFDARVFNIPKEEVANYFVWRQQDATRNSVQMLARHYFSHKEMDKKSVSAAQDMLMIDKGVNWNDLETWKKRGTCVFRNLVDEETPIFTQDRNYIENCLENKDD